MTTVGFRIKQCRNNLGMSQRELAMKMGYSNHSTITRIEAGKVDLPQSRISQFAEALDTTPAYLMGWEGAEPEEVGAFAAEVLQDPALVKLIKNYRAMSEADQYALRLMAESLATKTKKD